ncbi:MAG TPA: hypothetical protein VNU25_03515 [Candidatus Paceibacterota bacterium]|nr:hypothetical protein [Candidatus Paceibacterota bacterium]
MQQRSRSQFGDVPEGMAERGMSFDSIPLPREMTEESPFARTIREQKEGSLSPPPET